MYPVAAFTGQCPGWLQATFGYQFHAASHDGGTAYVKRHPLEIAPFVYLGEKARLGFGWRHNFKLKYDGRYNKSPTIEFGQSDGVYAELGAQYQPDVWFALRYIKESYKARPFDFRETPRDGVDQGRSFRFYVPTHLLSALIVTSADCRTRSGPTVVSRPDWLFPVPDPESCA